MIHRLYDFMDRNAGELKETFRGFPYMRKICEVLEDCITGNLPDGKKNLVINIPPRCFKTQIISKTFPAWCFAEISPDCEFLMTSATAELTTSNAIAVKRIINSEWYQEQYPHVKIDDKEKDVQHYFKTTARGSLYASGLGGTITGFGAGKVRNYFGGALIIDDPLKANDEKSPTKLKNCIDYYTNTLLSRRNNAENTPIILIMQRLHVDDLAGYVLKNEPDDWFLLNIPARDEEKNVINPITLSNKTLDMLQEVNPELYWSQYMQQPRLPGGNIIKAHWWKFFDPTTHQKRGLVFLTADTALKDGKINDVSVIRVWEGTQDYLYCLDAIYGRWEYPELKRRAREFWLQWKEKGAREFWIEDKASGTPLQQELKGVGIPARAWTPKKFKYPDDKVGRMKVASWAVYGGRVLLPIGSYQMTITDEEGTKNIVSIDLHSKALIEEAAVFASDMSHAHDDHCDAFTIAHSIWKKDGGGRGIDSE